MAAVSIATRTAAVASCLVVRRPGALSGRASPGGRSTAIGVRSFPGRPVPRKLLNDVSPFCMAAATPGASPALEDDWATKYATNIEQLAQDLVAANNTGTDVDGQLLQLLNDGPGSKTIDWWFKKLLHVKGEVQIFPPMMDLTVSVKLPIVGEITIGRVKGAKGCVGKAGTLQACLELRTDGVFLDATVLGKYNFDGYIVKWSKFATLTPKVAATVPSLEAKSHPSQKLVGATIRDPDTHAPVIQLHTFTFKAKDEVAEHLHVHDTVALVTSGELKWVLESGKIITGKGGDVVQIPGGTKYKLEAVKDSHMIAPCILYIT